MTAQISHNKPPLQLTPEEQAKRRHKNDLRNLKRKERGSAVQDKQNAARATKRAKKTEAMRQYINELQSDETLAGPAPEDRTLRFGWSAIEKPQSHYRFAFPMDYLPATLFKQRRSSNRLAHFSQIRPLISIPMQKPDNWPDNNVVPASIAMSRHLELYRVITGRELTASEGRYLSACQCGALCLFEPKVCHECLYKISGIIVWVSHVSNTPGRLCGVFAGKCFKPADTIGRLRGELLTKLNGSAYNLEWDGQTWSLQQTRCYGKFVNTRTKAQEDFEVNCYWDLDESGPLPKLIVDSDIEKGQEFILLYAPENEEQLDPDNRNPLYRRGAGRKLKWE